MTDTNEVFQLLNVAKLAGDWPDLHPIRDRALEKLREIAKQPAHTPAPSRPSIVKKEIA